MPSYVNWYRCTYSFVYRGKLFIPFKIIPGDVLLHNGNHWYVFARSIQDGESILMSRRVARHFVTTVIIPTEQNCKFVPVGDRNPEDIKYLSMQDYSVYAMYFYHIPFNPQIACKRFFS